MSIRTATRHLRRHPLFGALARRLGIKAESAHDAFVEAAFEEVLRRPITTDERQYWAGIAAELGHAEVLRRLFDSGEYRFRHEVDDRSEFWAGHFHSPVVDPEALKASGFTVDRGAPEDSVSGIEMRPEQMIDFWRRNIAVMQAAAFPSAPQAGARYHSGNEIYTLGDASILLAMLHEVRPKRVIEVGSGFSSACMLDVADRLELRTRFTFIEPYPQRLLELLTEADRARCEIVEAPVQQAELSQFEALERDDILFIDSTHISKAGSDVNHELFEILPRLMPGVIVHFHDTFWPFEYPESWIFEARRSWNELYILRAFLMGNRDFEVLFFNDYFHARHPQQAAELPAFALNPGGGLWLRRSG